jgi:uncharacterized protein (DUF2267 family)
MAQESTFGQGHPGRVTHRPDPFALAKNTAGRWLDAVARQLDTQDRHYAYRVLRAWLHLVRDLLSVDAVAHLGAQLPELLRGIYYEGWRPNRGPVHGGLHGFIERFADDTGISPGDVTAAVANVSIALDRMFSPGQLDHALAQLPHPLHDYLTPAVPQR